MRNQNLNKKEVRKYEEIYTSRCNFFLLVRLCGYGGSSCIVGINLDIDSILLLPKGDKFKQDRKEKKVKTFKISLMIVLVVCLVGAGFAEDSTAGNAKFNLKLGGAYLMPKVEYNYGWSDLYTDETMSLSSSLTSANLFGGSFGAGLSFMDNFEIYANYTFFKKTLAGDVSFTLPSYGYWDEIASTDGALDLEYKENIIDFGIAYHLFLENVAPYFGVGISLVSAKIETPATLNFTDRHEGQWYHYWWFYLFDLDEHVVDIDSVDVEEKSLRKTGFHFKAGVNFSVVSNIGFFLEGKYIAAKVNLPIKVDARSSGKEYWGDHSYADTRRFLADSTDEFEVDLGGFSAVVGIKISF